jgi:RNA polymerase sigma factor (TIGR02999 family)
MEVNMDPIQNEITRLLARLGKSDPEAEAQLIPIVFAQLRKLAAKYMRSERPDHTLQPTALVNEAYMRLVRSKEIVWQDHHHFFGVAARLMRQVLVDHARTNLAGKRPHGKVSLDDVLLYSPNKSTEMLALDQALSRLADTDARAAKVVELKMFAGLTFVQIAETLGVAEKTAKRDWGFALDWLGQELRK